MADQFKVGEIAIVVSRLENGTAIWPEYDGDEVEIIGPLQQRSCWTDREHTARIDVLCYRIRARDGKELCARPENLRKRRLPPPPREELGEWDLCPWKPERVAAGKTGERS